MSYSDEPNVISERSRSKKMYFVVGGLVVFLALLASVAFFPRFLEFQRRHTAVGPNEGSVYFIRFEGHRYSMELARSEPLDFHMAVLIDPARDETPWQPEEYHVRLRWEEREEFERLEWDPDANYFGLSESRYHPRGDFRFEIELVRGENVVWSGRRWSFRPGEGGHGHAH